MTICCNGRCEYGGFCWGFHWDLIRVNHIVTSHYLSPRVLFLSRVLFTLYIFAFWAYGLSGYPKYFFAYYTNWNFSILLSYYTIVTIVSFIHFRKDEKEQKLFRAQKLNHFYRIVWIMFQFSTANAFFLDAVYWILIFDPAYPLDGYTIAAHAMNILIVLFELISNRMVFVVAHFSFMFIFGILYMFFTWIYYSQTGEWVYTFLDWSSSFIVALYFGIYLVGFLFFLLGKLLCFIREKVLKGKCSGKMYEDEEDDVEMKEKEKEKSKA